MILVYKEMNKQVEEIEKELSKLSIQYSLVHYTVAEVFNIVDFLGTKNLPILMNGEDVYYSTEIINFLKSCCGGSLQH